jgi:hypothetical protein
MTYLKVMVQYFSGDAEESPEMQTLSQTRKRAANH